MTRSDDGLECLNTMYGLGAMHGIFGDHVDLGELRSDARMSRVAKRALIDQYRRGYWDGRAIGGDL